MDEVLVLLESPFAGDVEKNLKYARKCMRDCFMRGEFPFASHLLYTQEGILDDDLPNERNLGINAGLYWGKFASKTVVYTDLGITEGMKQGIGRAKKEGRLVEMRKLTKYKNVISKDLCLKDYWEYFKNLNSQNDILGVENFEDALEHFIKELKELNMNIFVQDDMFMNHSFQEEIDRLSGFTLHENTDDTKLKPFDNSNDVGYADHENGGVKKQ